MRVVFVLSEELIEAWKLHRMAKILRKLKSSSSARRIAIKKGKGADAKRHEFNTHRASAMLARQIVKGKMKKEFRTHGGSGMHTQRAADMQTKIRRKLHFKHRAPNPTGY